jgi:hypothetical protein
MTDRHALQFAGRANLDADYFIRTTKKGTNCGGIRVRSNTPSRRRRSLPRVRHRHIIIENNSLERTQQRFP